jgi:hypothetical protein
VILAREVTVHLFDGARVHRHEGLWRRVHYLVSSSRQGQMPRPQDSHQSGS